MFFEDRRCIRCLCARRVDLQWMRTYSMRHGKTFCQSGSLKCRAWVLSLYIWPRTFVSVQSSRRSAATAPSIPRPSQVTDHRLRIGIFRILFFTSRIVTYFKMSPNFKNKIRCDELQHWKTSLTCKPANRIKAIEERYCIVQMSTQNYISTSSSDTSSCCQVS